MFNKWLSKNLRLQVIEKALEKDRHEKLIQNEKKHNIISSNNQANDILFNLLPRPHKEKQTLFESTLEHFKVLTVPHLKAFIHIRMFDEVKIPKKAKFKFPKKGTVGEAQAGIRNLLSLAYDLRCKEVLFTVNDEMIERVEEENEHEQEDETVMIQAT